MRKTVIGFALSTLLFALSVSAQAQQPGKIPRIGIVSGGGNAGNLGLAFKCSGEDCKISATLRVKISCLSIVIPREAGTASRKLSPNW